jgi:hypothetical protein
MTSCLPIAIATAIISFIIFRLLYLRHSTVWSRATLGIAALAMAIPALLFSSNYILYLPYESWFIYSHSLPAIEASSGLVGALLGVVFASARLRPSPLNTPVLILTTAAAILLLITPFNRQLFHRLDCSQLEDKWADGVCLQTSSYTCVPASCATLVKMLGGSVTERELAIEAGTSELGTETWYMMRALRRHGYEMEIRWAKSLADIPAPAILGVEYGDIGHAVVMMSKDKTGPEIGNPKALRRHYSWKAFERVYHPELVYYTIGPRTPVTGGALPSR